VDFCKPGRVIATACGDRRPPLPRRNRPEP